jgi:hypothetical protein
MSESDGNAYVRTPEQRARHGLRDKAAQFQQEREARRTVVYEEMQTERVIGDEKTARLRALRLAKEEADREAARNAPPVVKGKKTPSSPR